MDLCDEVIVIDKANGEISRGLVMQVGYEKITVKKKGYPWTAWRFKKADASEHKDYPGKTAFYI